MLPEIRAYAAKQRLRRGIELVKLANRIEALKMQEDEDGDNADVPGSAMDAAGDALASKKGSTEGGLAVPSGGSSGRPRSLSRIARGAIFREVVLAKVRELKEDEARKTFEQQATLNAQNQKSPGKK